MSIRGVIWKFSEVFTVPHSILSLSIFPCLLHSTTKSSAMTSNSGCVECLPVAIQPSFEESKPQRPAGIGPNWITWDVQKHLHIHRQQLGLTLGIIPFLSPPRGQCFRCLDLGAQTDWNKIVGNGRLRQLHPTLERNWAPWLSGGRLKHKSQKDVAETANSGIILYIYDQIHSMLHRKCPFVYTEFLKMYHKLVEFVSCIWNPAKTRMARPQSSHPRKHSKPPAWPDAKKRSGTCDLLIKLVSMLVIFSNSWFKVIVLPFTPTIREQHIVLKV